jgi:signal transduction histidine kinase
MAESFATAKPVPTRVRLVALTIGLLAIALATTTTITSLGWIGRTFPGFVLLEPRLVAAIGLPQWSAATLTDLYLSEVVAVDGAPVASSAEINARVAELPPGVPVEYLVRKAGRERSVVVPTQRFTGGDWLLLYGSYLLNGVVFLACGLLSWALRPSSNLARAFLHFGGACALFLLTAMDLYGPSTFDDLYLLANALLPATALELALLFPEPHRLARWRHAGYPVALLVFALYEVFFARPSVTTTIFTLNTVYLGLVGVFFGSRLIAGYLRGRSELARQRVRVLTLGTLLGLTVPGVILILASLLGGRVAMNLSLFAFFVFPLSLAYAIVKHNLFDIDAMVKRAAIYVLITGSVGAAYGALVLLFNLVLDANAVTDSAAFPVLFTLAVLLLFNPLRERMQGLVDRVFFHTRYDGAKLLASVGAKLAGALRRDDIVRLIEGSLGDAFPSTDVRLFVDGPDSGGPSEPGSGERPRDELVEELATGRVITSFDPIDTFASAERHAAIRDELARLGAEIVVPMQLDGRVCGMIALGAKRSGLFYTAGDAEFLRALAQEAAIALQNAASYEALVTLNAQLEQRVQERTAQLRETNAQLGASNQELAHAYAELKSAQLQLVQSEKMAALGRLAAGVAHEINNPVSFIVSNVVPLRERVDEALDASPDEARALLGEARELIDIMGRGAQRTAAIVSDLKTFSRLGEAPRKAVDLVDGLDVSIRLLESRWRGRIRVHRDYQPIPLVECDAGHVNQVFMNLLANACDAIAGEGNIWVATGVEGERVVITVRDDGCGIAPDKLGQVFDPFFTTKAVGSGTGLGLAIVHGIVAAHGGRITVESELGRGTAFRVELPVVATATEESPRQAAAGR